MNSILLIERRLFVLSLACVAGFVGLMGVFWYVQVVHGERYLDLSKYNRIRRVVLPSLRGRLFSRNGHILVDNKPSYNVVLDWDALRKRENLENLSEFLGITVEDLRGKIRLYKGVPYIPMIVERDVEMSKLIEVEDMKLKIPELGVEVSAVRRYIHGKWAGQMLGYVRAINQTELKRLKTKGYRSVDSIGKVGVEKYCEPYLRGTSGGMQVQVDSRGYRDQVLSKRSSIPGHDVWLTIDKNLQESIENVLENKVGAAIALNPQTGEILAMVSKPGFDPNLFTSPSNKGELKKLFRDKFRPLFNRVTQGEFPPGSPFKVVVAFAALINGAINKNTTFKCDGKYKLGNATFRCWKPSGHGRLDIIRAIQYSCNVYFYNAAQILGPDKIAKMARLFGLGKKTNLDIGNERSGLVPDRAWKKGKYREPWYGGETLNYAIGQGFISVTPIQMAMMVSVIANGGSIWRPYVMKRVVSRKGRVLIEVVPRKLGQVTLNPEHLSLVREGMHRVVDKSDGTGHKAFVEGVRVAGKTGTVQIAKGKDFIKHGWFVSFAPFEKPEIVLVLFVENIESGGRDVAPLAGQILKEYFRRERTENRGQKIEEKTKTES